jgi:hypothetical protein
LTGTGSEVLQALEQLKQIFPRLQALKSNAYIEAEVFMPKAKLYKAATLYTKFFRYLA